VTLLGIIEFHSSRIEPLTLPIQGYKTLRFREIKLARYPSETSLQTRNPVASNQRRRHLTLTGTCITCKLYIAMPGGDTWDLSGANPLRSSLRCSRSTTRSELRPSPRDELHTLLVVVKDAIRFSDRQRQCQATGVTYDETIVYRFRDDPDFGHAFFSPLRVGELTP